MRLSHDEYMASVDAKINAAKEDLRAVGNQNEIGFSETVKRLHQSAENLYFALGDQVFEPVNSMFTAFSTRPGLNDVTNVAAVDIIDIGIQATRQSVMGYLSAERAMDKPIDTAWYQTLVSTNDAGGFTKDSTVFSPFTPISKQINLGPETKTQTFTVADTANWVKDASANTITIKFNANAPDRPLVTKSVVVTLVKAGTPETIVATAQDLKGQDEETKIGTLYWDKTSECTSATVNYETGDIVLSVPAGAFTSAIDTVRVTANIERTAQKSGANTLKVKPKTTTIQLIAKPNRIILENSFEDNAYMNKQAFNLSNAGIHLDFGKRAINQLLQTFVAFLDFTSVSATYAAADQTMQKSGVEKITLDLTDYLLSSSQAQTKNDFINQALLKLNKNLLKLTGKGPTCYLVDSEAAVVLGNCQTYFTANPTLTTNLDGVIGTYRDLPVIRHHVLDGVLDNEENKIKGIVIAVYKSPDGLAAPSMFGEYLPPYSVVPALNYDNPSQFSQSLLSMSVTEKLVTDFAMYMEILVSDTTAGS